jgi:hypothetical protein
LSKSNMQTLPAISRVFLLTAAMTIAGCGVIKSKGHLRTASTTEPGLVYSLPKGALQLVAERKQVAAEDIQKAKEEAEAAKAQAEISGKAWNVAKENLAKVEGELKTAPEKAKQKLEEAVALAQATVNYLAVVKDAQAATAKAAQEKYAAIADKLDKWVETASLSVLPNVPDGDARFVADLSHNYTRDDNVKLTVANGMLTTSTATAADQLPNILLSIAQAVGATNVKVPEAAQSMILEPGTRPPATQELACQPYNVALVFDPTDPVDTHAKLQLLGARKPGFTVTIAGHSSDIACPPAAHVKALPACPGKECNGLYYRVPVAVETAMASKPLDKCVLKSSPVAFASVFVVPDSRNTYLMPTRAGAFTTSKLNFTFKEGMPLEYSVEQPSEIAAIASIPIQVAKALISIPAEMIQLRVNHNTQANALIAAKTAELNAQIAQLQAQIALDAALDAAEDDDPDTLPSSEPTAPSQ